ncbi:MAG: metallophosphoesterase family protein [Chloroflexi bacterium]|nr:metallophosphoesterase family protein [Chloroflexota bacterium]
MKILTISDVVDHLVQSPNICERFADIDLILGCGDLPFAYMEYIVTMLGKPMYFVYGNHAQDVVMNADGYREHRTPGGCVNIHRRVVNYKGLLIGGLEGSVRYNMGAHQYSQIQMKWIARSMTPQLLWNQLFCGRAIDILITHAPPWGIHDADDLPHHGFKAYLEFMDRWRPRYLIHGHTHLYRLDAMRQTQYNETIVINTYGYQVLEINVEALRCEANCYPPMATPKSSAGG